MRKYRLIEWGVAIVVAIILWIGSETIEKIFTNTHTPKEVITVYAPEDMQKAFSKNLSKAELSSKYKIEITENLENADICVNYQKEGDENYEKFAFSPFVIGYSTDKDCLKSLIKANTIIPSAFDEEYYEIDLLKVINEVIEDGKWKNLGIENEKEIKLFYPAEDTIYWQDFYNFMLLTVNRGKYPNTDSEMKNAVEYVENFISSSCTEAVRNFDEKIERTGGFKDNSIFILPEKAMQDLSLSSENYGRLFYPLQTINFYYYITGNTDVGKEVVKNLTDKFYELIREKGYRNSTYSSYYNRGDLYDLRDVYNTVEVPKEKNFFLSNKK